MLVDPGENGSALWAKKKKRAGWPPMGKKGLRVYHQQRVAARTQGCGVQEKEKVYE